jgi:hypothetical protein
VKQFPVEIHAHSTGTKQNIFHPSPCAFRPFWSTLYTANSKTKKHKRCMYKRHTELRSPNNCYHGKKRSITYSGCVFMILFVQCAKRMRRIIWSFVACPPLSRSSTLSNKRYDFRKESYWIKIFLLTFCTTSVWNISHSKENSATYLKGTLVFM